MPQSYAIMLEDVVDGDSTVKPVDVIAKITSRFRCKQEKSPLTSLPKHKCGVR